MNWFNQLLRKPAHRPAAKTKAAPVPRRLPAPVPAMEVDKLRAALAASSSAEEREQANVAIGRALAQIGQAPQSSDGPSVWAAAVCHVGNKTQAIDWLVHIQGEPFLAEVAREGRFAEVRLAAAQRIVDGPALEQLARSARGKDKSVYRHCSEVLRERRRVQVRREHAAQLAESLRALLVTAPLSVSRLLELEKELHALGPGEDALEECWALCEQANRRVLQEGELLRRLQTAQQGVKALEAQVSCAAWPGDADFAVWQERLLALRQVAPALPDWPGALGPINQVQRGLQDIEERLKVIAIDGERIQNCERFLASIDRRELDPQLAAGWAALSLPQHPDVRQALEQRWSALQPVAVPPKSTASATREPAAAIPAEERVDPDALWTQIKDLEQAVDQGQLAEAEAASKRIKALVGSASVDRRMESRLQRAQARLGELRGWAQWGATKQREQLIEAAQALLTSAASVDHVSVAVPALRENWKQLNAQSPATKGQWETFDAALEKAYQPVTAQRAEEAERRAQARARKETLMDQWEVWLAAIVWERADYGAIEIQVGESLAQWRATPNAGFRDERLLRKRADAWKAAIEERFNAARRAEIDRRQDLIAAADALGTNPDLRHATSEVKILQERWRAPPGAPRLLRGEEQKLWRKFRAACDVVFSHREAQRTEKSSERERHLLARSQLLERFAASLDSSDLGQIKHALAQFLSEWRACRPAATDNRLTPAVDSLDRQARSLQERAQHRIEELRKVSYRVRLEQWRQQAPATDGLDKAALEQGRQARAGLLLDLEMALDLPTPEAFAQARRQRQLEQLQSHFRTGSQQRPDPEKLLAQWHAIAAEPDADQQSRLAAIERRLLARSTKSTPSTAGGDD